MALRKRVKHEKIVADVTASIRKGELCSGDRLLPFPELCRRYEVTQFTLNKALSELANAGLLVRQRRLGVFIAPGALDRVRSTQDASVPADSGTPLANGSTAPDMAARHDVLTSMLHFDPHSAGARISLFVTDGYPEQLALWKAVLDGFEQEHPRCRITLDHVDEDHQASWRRAAQADIVIATPGMLRGLGSDHMLPVTDLSAFGLDPRRLHASVADYVERRAPLAGVPFALVPMVLYLNTQAAQRLGIGALPQDSVTEFLLSLAEATRCANPEDRRPLLCGNLFMLLSQEGALSLTSDLRIAFDAPRARRVIEAARQLVELAGPISYGDFEDLLAGRQAGRANGLYFSLYLKAYARFPWHAQPLPVAPGATGPEMPMLCCGIRRETAWLPECMSLVHYLCQERVQRRLASLGHCVPVIAATAFERDLVARYPISEGEMRRVLKQGCLCWSETPENQKLHHDIWRIGFQAEQAGDPATETLARVDVVYRQYCSAKNRPCNAGADSKL